MARQLSTDVTLACHCPVCNGQEARISARKMRHIERLTSPAHEAAIHAAVTSASPKPPPRVY